MLTIISYGIILPLPSELGGTYSARGRQQVPQSHTLPDRPVRATDLKTWLPDGLNGAEAKREGGFPMAIVSMKALLESGVHFGHRTNKWDPRMKPFIFTERNGIHIIDLQQTVKLLNQAHSLIRDKVSEGGTILFVGTKRQAQETILDEATRCGMPYVTERWLGGTLTNWSTIYQRVQELERLEKLRDSGEINRLTKKEGLLIERDIARLERRLSGVRDMKRLPDLLFIVDVCREDSAVHEANLLNIPIIAMVDTNCNPLDIDYVIPSNDDAIRAIKLLVAKVADAVLEGKAMRKDEEMAAEEAAQPVSETAAPATGALVIDEDDQEIEEEDLLGEATLAKLNVSRKPAEEDEEEEEVEEKEKEKEEELAKSRGRKAKEEIAEAPAVEEVKAEAATEETSEDAAEEVSEEDVEDSTEEAAEDTLEGAAEETPEEDVEDSTEEAAEEVATPDEATEEEKKSEEVAEEEEESTDSEDKTE
ncbi:MAG: 30S ribosomal protein S2 [Anaerolineales bacterium]